MYRKPGEGAFRCWLTPVSDLLAFWIVGGITLHGEWDEPAEKVSAVTESATDARQGTRRRVILMILLSILVLAGIAWGAAEWWGEAADAPAEQTPHSRQVAHPPGGHSVTVSPGGTAPTDRTPSRGRRNWQPRSSNSVSGKHLHQAMINRGSRRSQLKSPLAIHKCYIARFLKRAYGAEEGNRGDLLQETAALITQRVRARAALRDRTRTRVALRTYSPAA
jgi:hypothetical protein